MQKEEERQNRTPEHEIKVGTSIYRLSKPAPTAAKSATARSSPFPPFPSRTHDGPQPSLKTELTGQAPEARRGADRFDKIPDKQALITPKMKNHIKAKTSNGEAFAPSMRAASRNPRKPATPKTVTAKSAIARVRSLVLRPMTWPSVLTMKG
jgi:hypothetical protein